MIRIALAAGGTAGHIYPALAVAEELGRRGAEVLFLGTPHGRERDLVRGYRLELLPGRPYQRTTVRGKAVALATIPAAVTAAARLLRRERIDAVIGFGGYASVGPVLAARVLGIWTAILEPNAVVGMANRFLAPLADRIYTGLSTDCRSRKAHRVGLPLRSEIIAASRSPASHNGRPRVFLMAEELFVDNEGIELIRPSDVAHVAEGYGRCDLVIGRAGAGTLAEISVRALPSIIVPLRAAEDHQVRNAAVYAAAGAAVVTNAADLNRGMRELLGDDERRRLIGQCARTLAAPRATNDLVDDLLQCVTR